MDFYGLGEITLSARDKQPTVPPFSLKKHLYLLRLNGDLNGILLLSTEHLPVESDSTSGLEMLNVLSARLLDSFLEEGLDLVMSPPAALDEAARARLPSIRPDTVRQWSGTFAGQRSFDFELQLSATQARPNTVMDRDHAGTTSTTEDISCSDLSLDS
jgi:hypothetical protein